MVTVKKLPAVSGAGIVDYFTDVEGAAAEG